MFAPITVIATGKRVATQISNGRLTDTKGGNQMNRRTLLLGTSLIAAMGVSAKSIAMDASLPMKVADIDPAFDKAFNAGDMDTC